MNETPPATPLSGMAGDEFGGISSQLSGEKDMAGLFPESDCPSGAKRTKGTCHEDSIPVGCTSVALYWRDNAQMT